MAKKTVFSQPTANESHSRNAFDRSVIKNVNFSAGMLIPTFCQFYFGHSHARINQRSFIRTANVNTAAFPTLPMYTDYFYVPMHQILTNWNAFRSRTNDRFSSRLGNISRLPTFSTSDFRNFLQYEITGNYTDDANLPIWQGVLRLTDLLGFGWNYQRFLNDGSDPSILDFTGDQTPIKACLYQKIYYDHYRNTAYENNDVQAYNLDHLYTLSGDNETLSTSISNSQMEKWFKLHYVNYKRDRFNTIYPSMNFIATAANGLQMNNSIPVSVMDAAIKSDGTLNSVNVSRRYDGSVVNVTDINTPNSYSYGISTSNIRAAFALEKLLRVSAFTPQHVKDQFRARFGYEPKSANLHESMRIGSFKNDIAVGEITSTAMIDPTVPSQRLGAIGGRGIGRTDYEKTLNFDVPEDGFIMGISYVLPTNTYDSNRVDPINQQFIPEDWSLPEYENLGLQPILGKNLYLEHIASDTDTLQAARGNTIFGYQPRDMQFKTDVSTNHGLFVFSGQLSPFVLHGRMDWLQKIAHTNLPGVSYDYFKCVPQDLNSIFVVDADGDELNDQFFGCFNIASGVIMDKPILGIPKL